MIIAVNAALNPSGGAIPQLVNIVRYISCSDDNLNLFLYVNK